MRRVTPRAPTGEGRIALASALTHTGCVETDTPDVPTTSNRSSGWVAATGGGLVVVLVGGIVAGALATRQAPTSHAMPGPPAVVDAATVAPAEPASAPPGGEPSPEPTTLPHPGPTPTPTPPWAEPAASAEPVPTPTARPARSQTASAPRPGSRPDPRWLDDVVAATGVPRRALEAYALATLTLQRERASCSLGWNTLAAIGQVESRHGSYGGAVLAADGTTRPHIIGPALDGKGFASIPDTDGGALDGDGTWDRAVGPMQFIPSTWASHGADGNGDGVKDPHNIDDAALAAGRYLCASGGMESAGGWRNAVIGYNRSEQYLAEVAGIANEYARRVPR